MNKCWAFIFKSKGSNPAIHRTKLEHPGKILYIYGVSENHEAISIIKALDANQREKGKCLYIELCGAFNQQDLEEMIRDTQVSIPIGVVTYTQGELLKMYAE